MAYSDLLGHQIEHAAARLRTAEELAGWLHGAALAGTAAVDESLRALSQLRRAFARWRARRAAMAELYALDSRTLADLGIASSEISSVVAEAMGDAPPTRLITLPTASRARYSASTPNRAANENVPAAPVARTL